MAAEDKRVRGLVSGLLRSPRRDGVALGFGASFIVLGVLGLLHTAGLVLRPAWACVPVLVGLGAAGLLRVARAGRP